MLEVLPPAEETQVIETECGFSSPARLPRLKGWAHTELGLSLPQFHLQDFLAVAVAAGSLVSTTHRLKRTQGSNGCTS